MHLLLIISCLAAVFSFFFLSLHVDAARPGTFVYAAGCSPSRYAPNTAFHFQSNLNSLLAASMASTRRALAVDDTSAAAAAYAYHRCSAGTSGDAWFLRSRDAVLSDLQAGVGGAEDAATAGAASSGGYKVSASGPVQGVAECLGGGGGAAAGDCGACLSQATAQLRGTCGAALAADVYLVQCSVRYWTNASYGRSSSQGNPEDDAGRTLAIAIGISAGVAALVVFISFLRKACSS